MTTASGSDPVQPVLGVRGVPFGGPLSGSFDSAWSVAWAQDGSRSLLAVGTVHDRVYLWQVREGSDAPEPLGLPLDGLTGGVWTVAWARDGDRLLLAASASVDRRLHLWQVQKGADVAEPFPAPDLPGMGPVASLAWFRDGARLLLAAGTRGTRGTRSENRVFVWQLPAGAEDFKEAGIGLEVTRAGAAAVAWALDGSRLLLAALDTDGFLHVWHVRMDELDADRIMRPLEGPASDVASLAWAQDGSRLLLAVGRGGSSVEFLLISRRSKDAERLGEPLTGDFTAVRSLAWARDGEGLLLAIGDDQGAVHLAQVRRDSDTAVMLGQLANVGSSVSSLAWTTSGARLLLAGADGLGRRVHVWEVQRTRTVPRLPGYRSDRVGGPAVDDLHRGDEAHAVAELVASRTARPPLAVGVFGDWGEGKSHFLELVSQHVSTLSGSDLSCEHVRQVRFNAWHYAETNLWASLVAELFTQLAAGAPGGDAGTAQRELSRLTADLVGSRQVRERLAAARRRRDDLQRALREVDVPWKKLDEASRRSIVDAAGGELPAEGLYRETVGGARVVRGALRNVVALARSAGRRAWLWFILALVVSVAAPVGAAWLVPHASRWVALSGVVFLVQSSRSAMTRVKPAWDRLGKARERVRIAVEALRAPLKTAVDVASAEVAALEGELQNLTAAGQLAGLVGERAASGDYRSQLGLMAQIREDFQRMATLLADASRERGEAGAVGAADGGATGVDAAEDPLPQIDRIVVYIDDLDRCPPGRVVEMLEAIHLLLAVELFVVIVAVDPRWLLRSISAHYRDVLVLDGASAGSLGDHWANTPAQYLEKIFQVVLTLRPVTDQGYRDMVNSLIAVSTASAGPEADPLVPIPSPSPESGHRTAADAEPDGTSGGDEDLYGPVVTELPVVELTDPLTFTEEEADLLRQIGSYFPMTPRAIKRLVNSYGLMCALHPGLRASDHAAHPNHVSVERFGYYRPYRAGMVLLAALIAFPAQGFDLCQHLRRASDENEDPGWLDFLAGLAPQLDEEGDGTYSNAFMKGLGEEQALHWTSLRNALEHISHAVEGLPRHLRPWSEWVERASRLSFPASLSMKTAAYPMRQTRLEPPFTWDDSTASQRVPEQVAESPAEEV